MANSTDPFAEAVHGTNPQNLVEKITRLKIYNSLYWKEQCFGLTSESIVDKAVCLKYYGGTYAGNNKPTNFLCLLLKMLQLQPEKEIVIEFIKNEDFKYVRALGAFYMRLVGKPEEIHKYLEPLYNDYRKIIFRGMRGWEVKHIDEFIDSLLTEELFCDIALPYLPKRRKLEELNLLQPRRSALEDDIDDDDDEKNDLEEHISKRLELLKKASIDAMPPSNEQKTSNGIQATMSSTPKDIGDHLNSTHRIHDEKEKRINSKDTVETSYTKSNGSDRKTDRDEDKGDRRRDDSRDRENNRRFEDRDSRDREGGRRYGERDRGGGRRYEDRDSRDREGGRRYGARDRDRGGGRRYEDRDSRDRGGGRRYEDRDSRDREGGRRYGARDRDRSRSRDRSGSRGGRDRDRHRDSSNERSRRRRHGRSRSRSYTSSSSSSSSSSQSRSCSSSSSSGSDDHVSNKVEYPQKSSKEETEEIPSELTNTKKAKPAVSSRKFDRIFGKKSNEAIKTMTKTSKSTAVEGSVEYWNERREALGLSKLK